MSGRTNERMMQYCKQLGIHLLLQEINSLVNKYSMSELSWVYEELLDGY
jgi:hypothetical protein